MANIFVLEDDNIIYDELEKLLVNNGYGVVDGRIPDNIIKDYDAALLDIGLPDISGYDVCRKIRETKSCPIIFITSMDKPENELMGFAVGGDDFIRKPFNAAVLIARISRHLKKPNRDKIVRGRLTLDSVKLTADNGDKSVGLSKTEFTILKILAEDPGAISRKELIESLWDNESYIDENTLYININRLRNKLKEIDLDDIIATVRGIGYRLECDK